jgi:hypothetical protein
MSDQPSIDPSKIEAAINEAVTLPRSRPTLTTAMQTVDKRSDTEAFRIEAFVDQALHQRIMMMRGAYAPGPRDMHVRKMVLEAITSIKADNASG